MSARLDLAESKGCDGVEPDNVQVSPVWLCLGFWASPPKAIMPVISLLGRDGEACVCWGGGLAPDRESPVHRGRDVRCEDIGEAGRGEGGKAHRCELVIFSRDG